MTRVHATLGSLASILECYELIPEKMEIRSSMLIVGKVFSDLFEADGNLESKIDRMISIFENNEIRICGVTI